MIKIKALYRTQPFWQQTTMTLLLLYPILITNFTGWTQAAVLPDGHRIDCEHFDERNCTTEGDCAIKVEHCKVESEKTSSCYVLWTIDRDTGETKIKMKGCFTDMHECNQTECITSMEPRQNKLYFCCCKGSMCNREHKWIPTTTEATTQVPKEKTTDNTNVIYVVVCAVVFVCLALLLAPFAFCYYRKRKPSNFNEIPTNETEATNASPLLNNRPIHLLELKASGRFGDVWQGKLHSQDVAVKIFRMQEKESWNTEVDIYKLPRMRHPNILEFLGCEKHTEKVQLEYWLISVYHPNGSLCNYLKSHTLTWLELCKIAESMSQGLMHLHEEIPAGKTDGLKPSIAHRDFKSTNVLLKGDLTACIADFGLAMVFQPGKPCGETHGQVGTRRYMAPEVLEGAINFNRDAFLRIDVYACGLVLWEMVSRCTAVGPVGDYMLPFEAELGLRPTLDEIQDTVVTKKLRPRLLNTWRTHVGLNIFCDTMEECWDHDAEARLSSSCVMERFAQLCKYTATPLLIENNTNCEEERLTANCL
ncbi:activin receptor type-2B isoform X1 [Bactrocera oleae]|uniref:activin receptor type-2B isoform X1 n=1 Tax=Bactrocera oleae TaxID=104688 RepID=UPI0006B846AE|nr:activin receptor type-2B [Bactrocera oleae]XP_036234302.1 activin receptor type-2B [Bactrocera oleae]XP_036234303.1 activin receptor type-2B [Bactrocera oleae]XP_036234304.1 activin receptor type-2B [Bactrocera oleae]XP_036234305.1 activin receptor type-2B [Bactrocera oleae]